MMILTRIKKYFIRKKADKHVREVVRIPNSPEAEAIVHNVYVNVTNTLIKSGVQVQYIYGALTSVRKTIKKAAQAHHAKGNGTGKRLATTRLHR